MITDKTTKAIIKEKGTAIEVRDIKQELRNYLGIAQILWFIFITIMFFNSILNNVKINFYDSSIKMFLTFSGMYLLFFLMGRFLTKNTFLRLVSNGRLKLYESIFLSIAYISITKIVKLIWFAAKTEEIKAIYFIIHSLFFILLVFYFVFKSLLYFMYMISSHVPSAEILLKSKKINLYYFVFIILSFFISVFIVLNYKQYLIHFKFNTEFDYIYAIITNVINILGIAIGFLSLLLVKRTLLTNMFITPFMFAIYIIFFSIPWAFANLFYETGNVKLAMKIYFYGEIYQFINLIVFIIVLFVLYNLKKHYNGEVEI